MRQKTILGIDPGTRFLGAAVLRGDELLEFGVHQLRNGSRPYDVIGQARSVVLRYIERYTPDVVAIEAPYLTSTKRAAVLSAIAQELSARARELGIQARELSPEEVRKEVTGNPKATKIVVAETLIQGGFPELKRFMPRRPARSALGLRPKDKYWLHMFDALALAQATKTG
jgi:Holliday junction resolvasome RuvABC endonuclease subunit